VPDFPALQQRVHRHDHGPRGQGTVEQQRERQDVRHHERDPVTGPDPALAQQSGGLAAALRELRVGKRLAALPQGRPPGLPGPGCLRLNDPGQIAHRRLLSLETGGTFLPSPNAAPGGTVK